MTNHSGRWHASDDVVRLLSNDDTTTASVTITVRSTVAAIGADAHVRHNATTHATQATATAYVGLAANGAAIGVSTAIGGGVGSGGRLDDDATAATALWPNNDTGDPLEFNQTREEEFKLSYDTGSNFMLLLEDFGEYFYSGNNGSDAAAAAAAAAAAGGNGTAVTLFEYNCTMMQLANGTCGPPDECE